MAEPVLLLASSPFVGRSRELLTLRALVPHAESEGRRIALVGGEAGSGKSRLVREFAREVAEDGVLVLTGACDAVVRTPYRPFVEALDQLVRATDPDVLRAELGSAGGELTRIFPDLSARLGGLPDPVAADPDTERHRLHTAVTDLLAGACRRRPLVLVIEDGHWADGPTLQLLRHVARSVPDARLLVLATFRDTEADVPAELADALADLRRSDDVIRLSLGGLTDDDVAEYLRRSAGAEVDPALAELAHAIRALTEGNAFLLCELWRTLVETDAIVVTEGALRLTRPLEEIATPQSVREVVSQRLSRLDATTRDLLELAAVAGTEFELDLLRHAAPEELKRLDALEPAVRSGMIEEVPAPRLAYRFTHELVRRALYDRLSGLRRAELHLRVGEALEALAPSPDARALADLAYHFAAAVADRRPGARRRVQPARGTRRIRRARLRGGRRTPSHRAPDRDRGRAAARRDADRARHDPVSRRDLARLAAVVPRGGRDRARHSATASCSRARRRASRTRAGARRCTSRARGRCSRRPPRRSRRRTPRSGSGSSPASPARSSSRAPPRGPRRSARRRSRWRGGSDDRRGPRDRPDARVLGQEHAQPARDPRDADEACELAEQIGDIDIQAEAMEWRVATLLALGRGRSGQ